jgi:hypothetical protein
MAMLEEYWQACGIEVDAEVLEIDRMEDSIAPLNEQTTQISALITAFSSCYHEADKEAERIIQAIGSGSLRQRRRNARHNASGNCRIL